MSSRIDVLRPELSDRRGRYCMGIMGLEVRTKFDVLVFSTGRGAV